MASKHSCTLGIQYRLQWLVSHDTDPTPDTDLVPANMVTTSQPCHTLTLASTNTD